MPRHFEPHIRPAVRVLAMVEPHVSDGHTLDKPAPRLVLGETDGRTSACAIARFH